MGRHDRPDVELAEHAGAGTALVEGGEQAGMDLLGARLDRRTPQRRDLPAGGRACVQLPVQASQPRARDPRLVVRDGDPRPAAEQLGGQRQARELVEHAHGVASMADVATRAGPIHPAPRRRRRARSRPPSSAGAACGPPPGSAPAP
jgi:hypothetical protein